MGSTANDVERLAYKERQHSVVTSNVSIVDYSFDLQAHRWCQIILKVVIEFSYSYLAKLIGWHRTFI